MKKILVMFLSCTVMLFSVSCGKTGSSKGISEQSNKEALSVKSINIATASIGGGYYSLGVALSEILTKKFPDSEFRVEVTGGTVENPGLVNNADCEIGLANTDMALFAYEGSDPFKEPNSNLRGWIGGVAGGVFHYCVLKNSGIHSLEDLIGKKIAVGPQGNSTSLIFEKLLRTMGHTWDGIKPNYLGFSDGIKALIDGKVDMAIVSAYPPVSAVQELIASKKPFKILKFEDRLKAKFLKDYPYYDAFTISKDIYGTEEDIDTVTTENMFMVNADLSENDVYLMTKAIFENLEDLKAAATSAGTITKDNIANSVLPLHTGAEKYYKEIGVMK